MSTFLSVRFKSALLCALCYVAAFLILASFLQQWFGFPLDDSWIHEVVARNLAEYKVLGFLPGQLSSGSTSLLWTLILAVRPLLFPALSPVLYCAGISVLILAGIGFVFKRMTEQDGLAPGVSWCIALTPAASGNFLWFGLIGMEHLLFILLSLGVIALWFRERFTGSSAVLLALLGFLLVITRPEGVCLVALLFLFRNTAGRSIRDWLTACIGAFFAGILSAAVNWMTGHHLTPLTMQGRNGVLPSTSWIGLRGQFIGHTFARFLSVWSITLPQHLLHGRGLLLGLPVAVVAVALLYLAVRGLCSRHAHRVLLFCAWADSLRRSTFSCFLPRGMAAGISPFRSCCSCR